MIKRIIIISLMCLFLISAVSCGGGTPGKPVVPELPASTEEVPAREAEATVTGSEQKALASTSASEAIKAFYLAANEKNYSEAQKYLFSDFLALFEKPPISQVGGIERILDLFTANGAIEEITLEREELFASSVRGVSLPTEWGWSPEIAQAIQQGDVEVWEVGYTIEFMPPLGEQWEDAYVVKEGDSYKISAGHFRGLTSSIINAATSAPWDFKVYDIYSHPGREGYTKYEFLIGMNHSLKELVSRIEDYERAEVRIKAVWEQYEYKGSFYPPWVEAPTEIIAGEVPDKWVFYITSVEYWPSGYTFMTAGNIEIPAAITNPTFYLITPDLRWFKIDPDGPWPEIPASPTLEWFRLGQTMEVKDYWAITPVSFEKSNEEGKSILKIRLKNLSGYDQEPEESLYFLQIRPVIEEFSYELSRLGVIPPFFEIEFEIEIPTEARVVVSWEDFSGEVFERRELSIPVEGAKADLLAVVQDRVTKEPISYEIYRLK